VHTWCINVGVYVFVPLMAWKGDWKIKCLISACW